MTLWGSTYPSIWKEQSLLFLQLNVRLLVWATFSLDLSHLKEENQSSLVVCVLPPVSEGNMQTGGVGCGNEEHSHERQPEKLDSEELVSSPQISEESVM